MTTNFPYIINKRLLTRFGSLFLVLLLLSWWLWLSPSVVDDLKVLPSLQILDCEGSLLRVYLSEDDSYHFPVTLDEISPHLVAATLSYEDHYFYSHPGINPISLIRAGWLNLKAGKVLSGGSTISQQVARMLENRPRNLPSKLIEALHAFQLEARYSKDEILEAYLNRAPYGGNIVGVGASSRIYFDKHVSVLGPGEAALLASLPKSPESRRPDRHHKVAVHSRMKF